MFAYNPQHVYITNYVLATKVLIWFSRTCVEIVVSWIPDSISEFLNLSILIKNKLTFFLTVLMSPDRIKHTHVYSCKNNEKW